MKTNMTKDPEFLLNLVYLLGSLLLGALRIIYSHRRKNRYLKELLRRKSKKNIERENEIFRIATESYATGPVPTFKDLVNNTERNWKVLASERTDEDDNINAGTNLKIKEAGDDGD